MFNYMAEYFPGKLSRGLSHSTKKWFTFFYSSVSNVMFVLHSVVNSIFEWNLLSCAIQK